ncbi:DUF6325 family protein [Kitasatospora sp. NPDC048365]|uniref:DUF6325 family protein n=1 Tax=Kitasatospora sp. NPDC048365 TaxID=3364050 RepID=UPI00371D58EC
MSSAANEPGETDEPGPIDYVIVEFPGSRLTGEGMPILVDLVERGIIRILDLSFVHKEEDGSLSGMELADIDGDGKLDLTLFEGAASGLLDQEDVSNAGGLLNPGDSAAILVYENLWAAPFAAAMRRAGARLIASGRIPVQDVVDALDALETEA